MQEHAFLPEVHEKPADFWAETKKVSAQNDMDEILAYMHLMLQKAKAAGVSIRRENFVKCGKGIAFFDGVTDWFDRIDAFGKELGVSVAHYVISSGMREMIAGASIHRHFKYVFASGYMYDADDVAVWPALAVNYTNKTQYLFRINKGIENAHDNTRINKYTPDADRPVPFANMVYIGDGETDIPAMKMLKHQGGHAIAVYNPHKRKTPRRPSPKDQVHLLLEHGRADFALPADYREGKPLDRVVKGIIRKVAVEHALSRDARR
jgi:hypothetical protein